MEKEVSESRNLNEIRQATTERAINSLRVVFFFGFDRAFNWNIFTFYASFSRSAVEVSFFLFEWFSRTPTQNQKEPRAKNRATKKAIEIDSKLLSFSF